jgi:cytochrome c oxidase subunit 2
VTRPTLAGGRGRPAVRRPAVRVAAAVVLSAVVVGGCLPATASTGGQATADLWWLFVGASVVVLAIVWLSAAWVLLRYRRRGDSLPKQTRGNLVVEVIWTTLPLLTVVGLFIATLRTIDAVENQGPATVQLQVTAYRWGWQATYPGTSIQLVSQPGVPLEIVLPVDTTIQVNLTSIDVDHAFFVPAFLFKRDAIPNHPTSFSLRITNTGTYPGACAEYCGILHFQMPFTIRAVDPATYASWLGGAPLPSEASGSPAPAASPGAATSPGAPASPAATPGVSP